MLSGVRPSIFFASVPTATILGPRLRSVFTATTEGSDRMTPLPRTYTRVLAVPRSMAISLEKNPVTASNSMGVFPGMIVLILRKFCEI